MRRPPAAGSQQDATTPSIPSPTAGWRVANDPVAHGSSEPCTVIRRFGSTDRHLATSIARNSLAMPVLTAATSAANSSPRQSSMVPDPASTPTRTSWAR